MKNRFNIAVLLIFVMFICGCASVRENAKDRRERREEKIEKGFEEVKKTVFAGLYIFKARRVNPGAGFSPRDLTGYNSYLAVEYYDVESYLPFFGTVHIAELPNRPGINIEGKLENLVIEEKNYRHRVVVKFDVDTSDDKYQVTIDIAPNFDASLTISSSKRSTITYTGKLYQLEIDDEEEKE